mmetsp:Transcript_16286/g.56936  ORF Transcript_16286/g.56936 Transcript_16286/m.56936 type:complete len:284 (-) Transcript_16286:396-1247(-)
MRSSSSARCWSASRRSKWYVSSASLFFSSSYNVRNRRISASSSSMRPSYLVTSVATSVSSFRTRRRRSFSCSERSSRDLAISARNARSSARSLSVSDLWSEAIFSRDDLVFVSNDLASFASRLRSSATSVSSLLRTSSTASRSIRLRSRCASNSASSSCLASRFSWWRLATASASIVCSLLSSCDWRRRSAVRSRRASSAASNCNMPSLGSLRSASASTASPSLRSSRHRCLAPSLTRFAMASASGAVDAAPSGRLPPSVGPPSRTLADSSTCHWLNNASASS